MRRFRVLAVVLAALLAGAAGTSLPSADAKPKKKAKACAAPAPMKFDTQTIVDPTRTGGEPTIEIHPDGTLLYSAHASTTLFYTPEIPNPNSAAYAQNYRGQTYMWWSEDQGETWHYAPRELPPTNVPMSGFSDPEFAIDSAGNIYISEINLVNVAVSRSTDSGRTYELMNFFGQTLSDRQWMEADQEGVVYMVGNNLGGGTFPNDPVGHSGHTLYRSEDGGATWAPGVSDGDGLGDLQVDKRNGTLYEAYYDTADDVLSLAAYRNARAGDLSTPEVNVVAEGVDMLAHWPSFDVDAAGNLYMTWDEGGEGDRPAGVYYVFSRNGGRTWSKPLKVSSGDETALWPWLAVGSTGRVGIAWLEADVALPGHNGETQGDHAWRIMAAQTISGLGCTASKVPVFRSAAATPEPVHVGTMCQGGTACQAQLIDRRLGDFFTMEIDTDGHMFLGYGDTSLGGMAALPGFTRQVGGTPFVTKAPAKKKPKHSSH